MISYIENKEISFESIERILHKSKTLNHYSNNGPAKIALEKKIESILEIDQSKRVICVNNGTAALHAIMMACKQNSITKFITPAFTFPSVCVGDLGVELDILDIDLNTYTLPFDKTILLRCDAIVITNLFGTYSDISQWENFCRSNNKILIFDNASSPASKCNGVNICNFGDYSFGSLHHTKYLGFGEGGFIVAPAKEYNNINSILNFGYYDSREHKALSSNFKMSDISAAFILQHIENYNLDKHKENQNYLINKLKENKNIELFNYSPGVVYGNLPILFNDNADPTYFRVTQIEANKYYKPLIDLENSNAIYDRIINFPLYASLNKDEMDTIIESIKIYSEK